MVATISLVILQKSKVLNGFLPGATEATRFFALESPGGNPPVPPREEEGESHPGSDRPVGGPEVINRSACKGKFPTIDLPPPGLDHEWQRENARKNDLQAVQKREISYIMHAKRQSFFIVSILVPNSRSNSFYARICTLHACLTCLKLQSHTDYDAQSKMITIYCCLKHDQHCCVPPSMPNALARSTPATAPFKCVQQRNLRAEHRHVSLREAASRPHALRATSAWGPLRATLQCTPAAPARPA